MLPTWNDLDVLTPSIDWIAPIPNVVDVERATIGTYVDPASVSKYEPVAETIIPTDGINTSLYVHSETGTGIAKLFENTVVPPVLEKLSVDAVSSMEATQV